MGIAPRTSLLALLGALTAWTPFADAANELVNSDFALATGFGGWTSYDSIQGTYTPCSGTVSCGAFAFSTDECCAQPASGSITATSPLFDFSSLIECVAVTENASYDYGAWIRLTNRPPGSEPGLPGVSATWYGSSDCSGTPIGAGASAGTEALVWTRIALPSNIAPAGAQSAAFALNIGVSGDAGVMVTAEYDSAFFGPSGSVPVGLASFSVE